MTTRTIVIAVGIVLILILALALGAVLYKRQSVISCANKAAEVLKKEVNADATSADHLYNVLYRICMGAKGFDH